jgi:dTDP-4-dehydrorhamnose 3,5-epimerase
LTVLGHADITITVQILNTEIPDVKILVPRQFADPRGVFVETYSRKTLAAIGIHNTFIQDNHSLSIDQGTVRGLHFQLPPFAQAKLVRVIRGSVLDVAVDIRRSSPTFGKHVAAMISAQNWRQIFIPAGFAHGFCTLEPNTEVVYKVDNDYSPQHDRGIAWNDPALGIAWPVSAFDSKLSEKDKKHPLMKDAPELF